MNLLAFYINQYKFTESKSGNHLNFQADPEGSKLYRVQVCGEGRDSFDVEL